jgi:hypothetical protein
MGACWIEIARVDRPPPPTLPAILMFRRTDVLIVPPPRDRTTRLACRDTSSSVRLR